VCHARSWVDFVIIYKNEEIVQNSWFWASLCALIPVIFCDLVMQFANTISVQVLDLWLIVTFSRYLQIDASTWFESTTILSISQSHPINNYKKITLIWKIFQFHFQIEYQPLLQIFLFAISICSKGRKVPAILAAEQSLLGKTITIGCCIIELGIWEISIQIPQL